MKKIKDRMILGSISALAINLPYQAYNALLHKNGKTDVPYAYSASRLFLTKKASHTNGGKLLSAIINLANVSMAGTAVAYTLSLTGKDYAILKGAGMGTMMWLSGAGLLSKLGLGIESKNAKTPLISLMEHSSYFALCAYLITKLGDESLFPEKRVKRQEKVPVIYTGQQPPSEYPKYNNLSMAARYEESKANT